MRPLTTPPPTPEKRGLLPKHIACCLSLLLALLLSTADGAAASAPPLTVFVSLPPQAAIVQRIGGELVRTHILVNAGQDPHTFEPKPRQIQTLARASLYFTGGLPFEQQITAKIRHTGQLAIIDTTAGIPKVMAADPHGHGAASEVDPHVWLAPESLQIMAENIGKALGLHDPDNQAVYDRNTLTLIEELRHLNQAITKKLAPYRGRTFYVFHPAFGYFAAAYGLRQQAVETGGKLPSPKQLAALIDQAKKEGVKIIFVQPQFDTKNAEMIASAIGGAVVAIDPLAPDIFGVLTTMANGIEKALR